VYHRAHRIIGIAITR